MNELLAEGLQLMGVGMGVVFLFLGLLVAVISLVSRVIQSLETKAAGSAGSVTGNDEDLIEVVTEAVKRYRADHHG
ncbi:oxaloacetate decarboxylase, gamma subunit [Mariprofundus ferrinatatus]|uniref:Oxaloacetate decarboxylase gamma chain n=1 Tax=Mariprofundus ferrinatatus TaxID=1921087 RepID=A0A2K8L342_9PROT|nr:OadG family transporter subunit [Mariprofundus ferrinatatus]ATX81755.1 oxaloacetate decarboxylase, gamma subunit [Mariprofundus ferrinatatus]